MARKRNGNNSGPIALQKLIAHPKRRREESQAAIGGPLAARRVLEFAKPIAADEAISDRIVFNIGGDRFAMHWRVEMERLPPAGPMLVEQKPRQKPVRSAQKRRSLLAKREGYSAVRAARNDHLESACRDDPHTHLR